ncbi:hypothetical protein STSP2_00828 [Anaerohalosphaera lusitana]|uniref:Uncharacterized protein n=1 Tax=Anaerohalosphaera lusitana TaxID=1936003 RepID=A0A1U9NJD2_9BACT|nr:hypothetical protein STSP2_00828 [Anaerohalosphaera lusitana]
MLELHPGFIIAIKVATSPAETIFTEIEPQYIPLSSFHFHPFHVMLM